MTNAKNRWGTVYPYFYCIGRARHRNCTQPAVLITDVEAPVTDYWTRVQLSETRIADIREQVMAELTRRQSSNHRELERQQKRIKQLQDQQLKLMEARYADAIGLDLLKSEQERISRELAGAQQVIEQCSTEINAVLQVVEEALLLCTDAHRLYLSATLDVRRQLNQAVFIRFWIINDQVQGADLTAPFAELLDPDLADRLKAETEAVRELLTGPSASDSCGGQPDSHGTPDRTEDPALAGARHTGAHSPFNGQRPGQDAIQRPHGPLPWETLDPSLLPQDQGLNFETQVELRGIEPLASSMRPRRSTN